MLLFKSSSEKHPNYEAKLSKFSQEISVRALLLRSAGSRKKKGYPVHLIQTANAGSSVDGLGIFLKEEKIIFDNAFIVRRWDFPPQEENSCHNKVFHVMKYCFSCQAQNVIKAREFFVRPNYFVGDYISRSLVLSHLAKTIDNMLQSSVLLTFSPAGPKTISRSASVGSFDNMSI